jgi:hypothetical protein
MSTQPAQWTQTIILSLDIFYNFTCQDLHSTLEDVHEKCFLFFVFLGWGAVGQFFGVGWGSRRWVPLLTSQVKPCVFEIAWVRCSLLPLPNVYALINTLRNHSFI